MKEQDRVEHIRNIDLGQKAAQFLESDEWKNLVKPIIDSMIIGLSDVRTLKKIDINSDKKASIQIEARNLAIEDLEAIEIMLKGYIDVGKVSLGVLERDKNKNDLYKEL